MSAPSVTTTTAGDLVVVAADTATAIATTPGSPWTNVTGPADTGGVDHDPVAYQIAGAAGTVGAAWTQATSGAWATVGLALEPALSRTAYSYDSMGRVTQILYGGATACVPSSGDCIACAYDDNGNLTSEVDNTGATTDTYDPLGRQTLKALPGATDACSGQAGIAYTYDPASNLTGLCDASGTTHLQLRRGQQQHQRDRTGRHDRLRDRQGGRAGADHPDPVGARP